MSDTIITICGRLTADPLVRNTRDQAPFCVFRIATSARVRVRDQPGVYEDGPASFYDVTAFDRLGANVVKSLKKGDPIVVTGRLRCLRPMRAVGAPAARGAGDNPCRGRCR